MCSIAKPLPEESNRFRGWRYRPRKRHILGILLLATLVGCDGGRAGRIMRDIEKLEPVAKERNAEIRELAEPGTR